MIWSGPGRRVQSFTSATREQSNSRCQLNGNKCERREEPWYWCAMALTLCVFAASLAGGSTPGSSLAVGQEWSIKTAAASTAKVIIGRIEPWRDKTAVHVSIVDITDSETAEGMGIHEIAHIPFEKSALESSLDKLVATGVPPARDFDSGYQQWKEHNGGIYTVSIAQALGLGM